MSTPDPISRLRYDAAPIDTSEGSYIKSKEGFLILNSFPSRAGILRYRRADGSVRRELRPPEEVFKMDSLQTLAGKPVTVRRHPPGLLNPMTVAQFAVGSFNNQVEVVGDGLIKCAINVHRQDGIDAVEKEGLRELSLGYDVKYIPSPGIWQGERYDGVQTNIVYNHGTILKNGRAGSQCGLPLPLAMRFDADDEEIPQAVQYFDMAVRNDSWLSDSRPSDFSQNKHTEHNTMARLPSGLLSVDLDTEFDAGVAQVLAQGLQAGQEAQSRADALEAQLIEERQARLDAESERDMFQGYSDYFGSGARLDMDDDMDDDDDDEEFPPKKKKKRGDMKRYDFDDEFDYDDDEDEAHYDAEDVVELAQYLAAEQVEARNDALYIAQTIQPEEDLVIEPHYDADDIKTATVLAYYPQVADYRGDSEEFDLSYIQSRFDSLLEMAEALDNAEEEGGGDAGNYYNHGIDYDRPRHDASDLEGLLAASHGQINGHRLPHRSAQNSQADLDPNVRRMNAWKTTKGTASRGDLSKAGVLGISR